MFMFKKIALLLIIVHFVSGLVDYLKECEDSSVQQRCRFQKDCHLCIAEHPCCVFCYEDDDKRKTGCFSMAENTTCSSLEPNTKSKSFAEHEKALSETYEEGKTVQITPQEYDIKLRKNDPLNITFSFKPVYDYPLDLYYLLDISYSMKQHIDNVKSLGKDLSNTLGDLTKNYRLGLGLFMDKPFLPFYQTADIPRKNPCRDVNLECGEGFLFKHTLNFTENMDAFKEEVAKVTISANNDDLDGASAALIQVLSCNKRYKWRRDSRKQVLMATDSIFHWAGDGLLAGAVKRNPSKCQSDEELASSIYDYPALDDVVTQMREKKTNLIIATKSDTDEYYKQFKDILGQNCYIGVLKENDTSQIINLIKDAYEHFFKSVHFFVNETNTHDYMRFNFYTDCGDGKEKPGGTCNNISPNREIKFTLQLELIGIPINKKETLYIQEGSLEESISLNLEYIGTSCTCSNLANVISCKHGRAECNSCLCDEGWAGTNCDAKCETAQFMCRENTNSSTCYGHGECECGKCKCDSTYSGDFCKYSCPRASNGLVCNGLLCDRGTCSCGEKFTGLVCDCPTSIKNCLTVTKEVCSGVGTCRCDKCECNDGFSGTYCNINNEGDLICKSLEECVHVTSGDDTGNKTCKGFNLSAKILVPNLDNIQCTTSFITKEGNTCVVNYAYKNKDGAFELHYSNKVCGATVQRKAFFGSGIVLLTIILGGLLGLLTWKYFITQKDKKEFALFEEQLEMSRNTETNPLYKDPVSQYNNPMLGTKL